MYRDIGSTSGLATGALCPSSRLASRAIGFRSLIVKQTVHLNTLSTFGHRTIESQVIHFPVVNSLSGTFTCLGVRLSAASSLSSLLNSNLAVPPATSSCLFFLPEKMAGKGWLIERPWLADLAEGEGPRSVGMPYGFSRISASLRLAAPRARTGDAVLVPVPVLPVSSALGVLVKSSRFGQGAIALDLSVGCCFVRVAQSL